MRLAIQLPTHVLIDREVDKVVAESTHGSFCLEPRHVDYVASLVPGILSFEHEGVERFVGVGEGVLVKVGGEVLVSVRDAVHGVDLGELRDEAAERFRRRAARGVESRQVAAKLEAALVQQLIELRQEDG